MNFDEWQEVEEKIRIKTYRELIRIFELSSFFHAYDKHYIVAVIEDLLYAEKGIENPKSNHIKAFYKNREK